MKRFLLLLLAVFICSISLIAEEFVAKHASYEKDGKKIEVNDLSAIPSFYADYYLKEDVVRIKCSAGNLVLTKGVFFYGYKGVHKGIVVTVRAYVENNKLEQIVYEELDERTRMTAIVSYYKR
ncbi:MAG: hypothetical protein IKV26_00120 [Paludibacteraceae bacterium]|nr:hypothetical protein [Paludibacteraceae bacterium]